MRRPLVLGNWKMNGSKASVDALINALKVSAAAAEQVTVGVCPPAIYLGQAQALTTGSALKLGAQDISVHASGAYTGESAAPMVREFGCSYVLVGHSERRTYHAEPDAVVVKKFAAIQAAGMTPVLCIGETLEERKDNKTEEVVATQLKAVIEALGIETLRNSVVAYEPVWAIGTGLAATSAQAQEVHAFIRQLVAQYSAEVADGLQLLYGGSVKASNAAELLGQADIDGALVGGAALNADDFAAIFNAA